jgi:hypothetical protein
VRKPKSVEVTLNLRFLQIAGTWEPNDAERRAAWELYVEMVTRVAVVPLPAGNGLLRESLTSLYSLFGTTRGILRTYGPDVAEQKPNGQFSFGYLAVAILNVAVRPFLARWHPELEQWEAARPATVSQREHEQRWPRGHELREELETTRQALAEWASLLAAVNAIPDLAAT